MEIATGAISTLLPKLGDLLKEEYKLQKSVRGEIMFLEAELEAMQTVLLKISSAPMDEQPDAQVNLWVREVRELSYDLEDNIDRFLVRIDHAPEQLHGLRGFIDRSLKLLTKVNLRRQIGTDIRDIKTRIREVSERHDRYKIDIVTAKATRPSVDSLRLSALHKRASELIGTEEKVMDVVKMLREEDDLSNQQLKIVSIVGLGGLGKTTLANEVYKKLKAQFECEAFVSVSLDPRMDQVFKSMLRQLDKDKYNNIKGEMWDETQLINELRYLLKNKRYDCYYTFSFFFE
jgi:Ni2+-binding GTPase involved in maturation of urease and hydrogenase